MKLKELQEEISYTLEGPKTKRAWKATAIIPYEGKDFQYQVFVEPMNNDSVFFTFILGDLSSGQVVDTIVGKGNVFKVFSFCGSVLRDYYKIHGDSLKHLIYGHYKHEKRGDLYRTFANRISKEVGFTVEEEDSISFEEYNEKIDFSKTIRNSYVPAGNPYNFMKVMFTMVKMFTLTNPKLS